MGQELGMIIIKRSGESRGLGQYPENGVENSMSKTKRILDG